MTKPPPVDFGAGLNCPIPLTDYPSVLLAHGGGGRLTQQLIQKMFVSQFANEILEPLHDGAVFALDGANLAFSTDSYVVDPVFFPGGDIGALAVNGTVNDLAMCGARPVHLSAGFIIEEGLPMNDLWRIVVSMHNAAQEAGVRIVTGDTKVVEKGKGDRIFINTSGIGTILPGIKIHPRNARPGDKILVNGPIAVHGIAIMSVREGLGFDSAIESDTAPLNGIVATLLTDGEKVHVLRDPTRGGVASSLNEIAESSHVGILRAVSRRATLGFIAARVTMLERRSRESSRTPGVRTGAEGARRKIPPNLSGQRNATGRAPGERDRLLPDLAPTTGSPR